MIDVRHRPVWLPWIVSVLFLLVSVAASAETLTVWAPNFGAVSETWDPVVAAFQEKHPGVEVEIVLGKGGPDALLTALAGGAEPDVAWIWTEALPTFVHLDALMPLDRFITPDMRSDYYQIDYTRYLGQIWGLPGVAGGRMIFYNQNYMDAAGVAEPETWDEFRDAARKLTRRSGNETEVWGFRINVAQDTKRLDSNAGFTPWFRQAGGEWFTEDGRRTLINSEEGREALTFLYELAHHDRTASLGGGSVPAGDLAMQMISTTTGINWELVDGMDIGVIPSLTHKRQSSWYAQDFWVILKSAKNPTLAFDFMHFAACGDGKMIINKVVSAVPVCRSEGNPFPGSALFEEVLANMAVLEARPIVLEGNLIYHQVIAEETGRAVLGEIPIEEALARAEERVNQILAEAWAQIEQ